MGNVNNILRKTQNSSVEKFNNASDLSANNSKQLDNNNSIVAIDDVSNSNLSFNLPSDSASCCKDKLKPDNANGVAQQDAASSNSVAQVSNSRQKSKASASSFAQQLRRTASFRTKSFRKLIPGLSKRKVS